MLKSYSSPGLISRPLFELTLELEPEKNIEIKNKEKKIKKNKVFKAIQYDSAESLGTLNIEDSCKMVIYVVFILSERVSVGFCDITPKAYRNTHT